MFLRNLKNISIIPKRQIYKTLLPHKMCFWKEIFFKPNFMVRKTQDMFI